MQAMQAKDIISAQSALESDRSLFEHQWQEIAELCLPKSAFFFSENTTQGQNKDNRRYDDTALLAVTKASSIMASLLTPATTNWHQFYIDGQSDQSNEDQKWFDRTSDFFFRQRYRTSVSFSSQSYEFYQSLFAFGTAVMIVEDRIPNGVYYKTAHIGEFCFTEDYTGKIDQVYRKYKLTAAQAEQRFGDEALTESMRRAKDKQPNEKFYFIHAVIPDSGKFKSYHVSLESQQIISQGVMKRNPYIISRFATGVSETYGRSPAMHVLSEIKMLNTMRRTHIRAANLSADPTYLAADAQTVRNKLLMGRINYGMLSDSGQKLIQPLDSNANYNISSDIINESRELINEAFFLNLFQILVDSPSMTATEVLQRSQEKGQMISPIMMRQESEFLNPLIENEIAYYEDYGVFEDGNILAMPQSIKEQGGAFSIRYTSPLAKMARAEDALSTERLLQSMLPLAQFDPNIVARFDFKEYGNIMRESYGAPAKVFKADEVVEAELQAKQQQEQLAQLAQAAPSIAGSIKDIAQAESYAATAQ